MPRFIVLSSLLLFGACGGSSTTSASAGSSGAPATSSTGAPATASTGSTTAAADTTSAAQGNDFGSIEGCAIVTLDAPEGGSWTVEGPIGFDLPQRDLGQWRYRAPAVVVDTPITLTHSGGEVFTMTVSAGEPDAAQAVGMIPDCAPFVSGVASGDPTSDAVWLWAHVIGNPEGGLSELRWEVATDAAFADVVAQGAAPVDLGDVATAHARAEGLQPSTTYYYRWFAGMPRTVEQTSVTGRTKTAPTGSVDRLRFAVTSCTSIFSGFFNGYRAVARRDDLDGLIHVGDYTYDFPDEDELIRIPDPVPADPQTRAEWDALHRYHLGDPDLRAARAAHPWVMLWDNHDLNPGSPIEGGGAEAFRAWNPVTPPRRGEGPEVLYRTLSFGDLLDVVTLDVLLFRDDADAPDTSDKSILGEAQRTWFHDTLNASSATWKIVGNQKPVAPILGLLVVVGESTWNGFPDARARMLDRLATDQVDNVMFLSGDAHITVVADLVTDPEDADAYDPETGQGAVAVEFQPASMSRGNVDEFFPGQPDFWANLQTDAGMSNPHYQFSDLLQHGYGIVDIDAERIQAEVWYLDILERTDDQALGAQLEVRAGENHWTR